MKIPILFLLLINNVYALDFYTVNLPPFSFVNKEVSGPFKEIAMKACEMANLSCTFNSSPWKRIMKNVESGAYDACFVIGKNSAREKWMYFTEPVVDTEYGFFSHANNKSIPKSYDDLAKFSIIVHEKSNTARSLKELKIKNDYTFKIIEELDVHTAIKKFENQRYSQDAILYGNKDIYKYILKTHNFDKYKYTFKDKTIQYRFGFSKKAVLKKDFDAFNKAILELKSTGQLEKYFKN